jgi:hypothetical protein
VSNEPTLTVYFIKSPKSNLTATETYLKKRGVVTHSNSDLKAALMQISELRPMYTFVAWDYPSSAIQQIPKIILQTVTTTIIPYCTSNEIQAMRQLQLAPFNHKLYPPLSGPALHRILLKIEKDSHKVERDPTSSSGFTKNDDNDGKNQIISQGERAPGGRLVLPSEFTPAASGQAPPFFDLEQRAKSLRARILTGTNVPQRQQQVEKKKNFYSMQLLNSNLPTISGAAPAYQPLREMLSEQAKTLSSEQKKALTERFNEVIADQFKQVIEDNDAQSPEEAILVHGGVAKNQNLSNTQNAYCLVLNAPLWTGYLLVASEHLFDSDILKGIVQDWVMGTFSQEGVEVDFEQGFIIKLSAINFEDFSKEFADYYQMIEVGYKKTILSFFKAPSYLLEINLHNAHNMIEVDLKEIPYSLPMPFDLHLYLPENEKFILYCKKNAKLAVLQHDRLLEKKIETLYSQLENESEIQKYRAERVIEMMVQDFLKQLNIMLP